MSELTAGVIAVEGTDAALQLCGYSTITASVPAAVATLAFPARTEPLFAQPGTTVTSASRPSYDIASEHPPSSVSSVLPVAMLSACVALSTSTGTSCTASSTVPLLAGGGEPPSPPPGGGSGEAGGAYGISVGRSTGCQPRPVVLRPPQHVV